MKIPGRSLARVATALTLLLSSYSVTADTPTTHRTPKSGEVTRDWLELQRSGTQAAVAPRQPGAAAARAYRRYLETFEQPVPKSYFEGQNGFVNQ